MTNGKKRKIIIAVIALVLVLITAVVTAFICANTYNEHLIYRGKISQVLSLDKDRKKTLHIGVSSTVSDIHPYNHGDEISDVLKQFVYEPLLNINNDCDIEYCNAKEIVFMNNGKQAKVEINSNKSFSDGTKLTAEIVYNSYQWFMTQETAYNDLLAFIQDIQLADDNTLVFVFNVARIDNIKVFNIPVVYHPDAENSAKYTALGTGRYAIDTLTVYSNVTLERNSYYGKKAKYQNVVINAFDYSNLDSLLESQDYDIFLITNKLADKVKESKAYNIYEMGQGTGWYLEYNMEDNKARSAVAKLAEGKEFFEATQDFGVYSKGLVSAYMKKPNYYSLLKNGSFDETDKVSFIHNYEAEANGIYRNLSAALKEQGIQSSETAADIYEYHPAEYEEDVLIYYGKLTDMVNDEEVEGFFEEYSGMSADDYYSNLEKYLSLENKITPLSKDTVWYASLAGRDDLSLFE
ncbi:MAG: hypothetical protein K2F65_00935 [Eubacterium sp.]|nr:hypothetical protein [Eubacterium sp.]